MSRARKTTPRRLPDDPRRGREHLAQADPALGRAIKAAGRLRVKKHPETLHALCSSIIGQQLSMHVARVIVGRFTGLAGATDGLTAERLLRLREADLRAAGLSRAKVQTVHGLARFWKAERLTPARLRELPDEELIELLTQVKGIGPWTVKMFLIFSLQRPDVLPQEDLGLRAGLQQIHGTEKMPSPREVIAQGECWRPWRTLATHYCWEYLRIVREAGKPDASGEGKGNG